MGPSATRKRRICFNSGSEEFIWTFGFLTSELVPQPEPWPLTQNPDLWPLTQNPDMNTETNWTSPTPPSCSASRTMNVNMTGSGGRRSIRTPSSSEQRPPLTPWRQSDKADEAAGRPDGGRVGFRAVRGRSRRPGEPAPQTGSRQFCTGGVKRRSPWRQPMGAGGRRRQAAVGCKTGKRKFKIRKCLKSAEHEINLQNIYLSLNKI